MRLIDSHITTTEKPKDVKNMNFLIIGLKAYNIFMIGLKFYCVKNNFFKSTAFMEASPTTESISQTGLMSVQKDLIKIKYYI